MSETFKCYRCNRPLKKKDSQRRGYGHICWDKQLIEKGFITVKGKVLRGLSYYGE